MAVGGQGVPRRWSDPEAQRVPRGPRDGRGVGPGGGGEAQRGWALLPPAAGQAGQMDTEELPKGCGDAEEQWRLERWMEPGGGGSGGRDAEVAGGDEGRTGLLLRKGTAGDDKGGWERRGGRSAPGGTRRGEGR